MKKIVALVLTLVLALSLATVAFGATVTGNTTTTTLTMADDAKLYVVNENGVFAEFSKVTAATKVAHEDDIDAKGVHTVYADAYTLTTDSAVGTIVAYKVSKDVATLKMVNGTETTYLFWENGMDAVKTTKTVTSAVAEADDATVCGSYNCDVYMIGGKAYAADTGSNWALYKGEFVQYGTEKTATPHTFDKYQVNAVNGKPTSIKCDKCGKVFTMTDTADKDWTASDFVMIGEYYVVLGNATTAASGVSSAKTFDAGVALYAGMALMSVAGSAVVIGKKKEF